MARSEKKIKKKISRFLYLVFCKVIRPITLSFTHDPLFSVAFAKQWNFIKSQYEMLKLSIFNAQGSRVIMVIGTGKSSENIGSSNGGAQEKGKRGWNSVYDQNWWKN